MLGTGIGIWLGNAAAVSGGGAPFSPSSLATLKDWVETKDGTTMWQDTGATSAVTLWNGTQSINNMVGKASNALQHKPFSSNPPKANTANSKNVAAFDGTDALLTSAVALGDVSGQLSASVAVTLSNITGDQWIIGQWNANNIFTLRVNAGVPTLQVGDVGGGNSTATGPSVTAGSHVFTAIISTSTFQLFVDGIGGSAVSTPGTLITATEPLALGYSRAGLNNFMTGNFQGLIIDGSVWNSTTRGNVESYLSALQ